MSALRRWQDQLAAWALPEYITSAVRESPWRLPVGYFGRRADLAATAPAGISYERAAQALSPRGSVLDVGAGAGAASLPLASMVTSLTAVDSNADMLDALRQRTAKAKVDTRTVQGSWPEVAGDLADVDVVVCHHVFYNAPDLDEFARALNRAARRRVVVELSARHPLMALNPLWRKVHDLDWPEGPSAEDAHAVLREAGIDATLERSERGPRPGYESFEDLVTVTRRRLCLPPERESEVIRALLDLGVNPSDPQELAAPDDGVVTLWWDRQPGAGPVEERTTSSGL